MSMEAYLDDRANALATAERLRERDAHARAWMNQDQPPEVRLLKFDSWVRIELETRLDWAWAGAIHARRIEQCRIELEGLVLALWRRGWMLDGQRLAGRVRDALDDVAKAQRAGRVREFWPFFKSVVDRFVGINAEEIRDEAMSAGVAVSQVFE